MNIIKRAYKQALGIPVTASNERFDAMVLHNTLDEFVEAQKIAQLERLSKRTTGRHILQELHIVYESRQGIKTDILIEQRSHICIPPLPRNTHPVQNLERGSERAKALQKPFERSSDVVYGDAAEYRGHSAMVVAVVDRQGHSVVSGTIRTDSPEVGEEAAIALALAATTEKFIISDSKSTIRDFAKGRISPRAQRILRGFKESKLQGVPIIWAPTHSAVSGNEKITPSSHVGTLRRYKASRVLHEGVTASSLPESLASIVRSSDGAALSRQKAATEGSSGAGLII